MSLQESLDIKPKDSAMVELKDIQQTTSMEQTSELEDLYIDPVKEKKLTRKLDFFLMPIFCYIYFLSSLDRSNIGNAKVVGLSEQLHLTNHQFSTAVSIFYATYVSIEPFGTLIVKKVGVRQFMAAAIFCWSMVTIFTCFVRSYGALIACRVLLGFFEGAVFPSQSLYISMVYKREEQSKRLGYLYICSCASGAFNGLIATGITKIKPHGDFLSWGWLYVIEGLISIVTPFWIWFGLPNDPAEARFLNDEEKEIMRIRKLQMQHYHGNQKFDKQEIFNAALDPKVWFSCAIQFCTDTVLYGFSVFLPSILKSQLGFTTMASQYLSIPVYVFAAIGTGSMLYLSDRLHNRKWILQTISLVIAAVGYIILLTCKNGGVNYFATYLIGFTIYVSVAINITWLNVNNAPHYRKAFSLGMNQACGNTAGAISAQVYRSAPYYLGNGFSLGCCVVGIVLTLCKRVYLGYLNKVKEQIISGERVDTKKTRTGCDALDFKYSM